MDTGPVEGGRLFDLFAWQTFSWENRGVLVPINGEFARCDSCGMACLVTEEAEHKCAEVKADA